jgi:2,3-bisphosphoglycerate-independent phosphoglycerate mutase
MRTRATVLAAVPTTYADWGVGEAPADAFRSVRVAVSGAAPLDGRVAATFADRFGVASGCMITGVDLLRGLAVLLGWENLTVEGMTSFHDTNYQGQGEATADALDHYDLVFSHVEAPDEASHQADVKTKVEAIEHIDKYIVGPVMEKLATFPEWRILVMPDHPTNIATRKHGYAPPPFAICGTRVRNERHMPYSEKNAAASDLKIARGHELMEYFLCGGNL